MCEGCQLQFFSSQYSPDDHLGNEQTQLTQFMTFASIPDELNSVDTQSYSSKPRIFAKPKSAPVSENIQSSSKKN